MSGGGRSGSSGAWSIVYDAFDPAEEGTREALFALGNGYFVTRGASEFADADDTHYPGTYLAGGYNRLVSRVGEREIENEDLVNVTNWLCLRVAIDGGSWLDVHRAELLEYEQRLDLRDGVMRRRLKIRDEMGRTTVLSTRRLVHMVHAHIGAIELRITALDWSGSVRVRSALDGGVENRGVARYRQLASRHLVPVDRGETDDGIAYVVVETSQSHVRVASAVRNDMFRGDGPAVATCAFVADAAYVAHDFTVEVVSKEALRLEKTVAIATSRDKAISEPLAHACATARRAERFERLAHSHTEAWRGLWRRCDTMIETDRSFGDTVLMQALVRVNIFHVLQTASANTAELDVGVPARGWTGEAYRGHIFWDELFILPFLTLKLPQVAEALLRYRWRRLDMARSLAYDAGYRGAMYPRQSGSDGREETPRWHVNPRSGRWLPDATRLQRHVNAAIVYNIWRYYQITDHYNFLHAWGAEVVFEIARFWSSIAERNPHTGRYEIHGVMGPDEFHAQYPGAPQPGLHNNAYTNVMAAWCCQIALETLEVLLPDRREELRQLLELSAEDLRTWQDVAHSMLVPFHNDGIISQFQGYEDLDELDWNAYRNQYGDLRRLDRILEEEGHSPDNFKVSKQADVLMLPYLFSGDELHTIFARLGYHYDDETTRRNLDYYLARTVHGSTLSLVVHSALLHRCNVNTNSAYSLQLTEPDVEDAANSTTREGIHLAAMAGAVDAIYRSYMGLHIQSGALHFDPSFIAGTSSIQYSLRFRDTWLDVTYAHDKITVGIQPGGAPSLPIVYRGDEHIVTADASQTFGI